MSAVLLTVVGDIKVDDKVVSRLIYAKVASAESNDEIMKLIRKILVAQLQKVKITIKMLLHYINKQGFDVINSLFFIFYFRDALNCATFMLMIVKPCKTCRETYLSTFQKQQNTIKIYYNKFEGFVRKCAIHLFSGSYIQ